jgi:predicted nucleic acid-binding protein
MMWVIDTSALIRLFVPDGPIPPQAETAFNLASSATDLILAPQLLLAEAGNVLLRKRRRGELSEQEMREILQAIQTLPIRLCEHGPLLLPACALAETHGLSVYDALYLALAEQHGARLVTSDEALEAVARRIGLA